MPLLFHKKPNKYISHVQLKVSDLDRSVAYYETVLGFSVLEQKDNVAYLTADGKKSLISLVEVADAIPRHRGQTGLYHFALLLPSRKDLANFVQHLIQVGERLGAGEHHVSEAIYLYDPDGNGIEVYRDRPVEDWIWLHEDDVHMVTEAVDFESLLAEGDNSWTKLPEDTVIGHIHLSVGNLAETEDFYINKLGYDLVKRYTRQALFISTGKYHHHIGLNTWESLGGDIGTENSVGIKSYTIMLADEETAVRVKEKLAGNVEVFDEAPEYGGAQLFSTVDPSGIRIVFTIEGE